MTVSHVNTAPTILPVFSSFQAFRVQLSYCRLKLGYISAFLPSDRSAVGEKRKIKRGTLKFNYKKVAFSHD